MQAWVGRMQFRCVARGYLPHSKGRPSARLLPSQARACFVWHRLWAIRRSEVRLLASVSCRGRRRQGTRVQGPGSIGGVRSVAIVLNTRQGTFRRLVLPDLLVLAPSVWYLTRPCCPSTVPEPTPLSFPRVDRRKSVFSARHTPLVQVLPKGPPRPSSRILQCGTSQQGRGEQRSAAQRSISITQPAHTTRVAHPTVAHTAAALGVGPVQCESSLQRTARPLVSVSVSSPAAAQATR